MARIELRFGTPVTDREREYGWLSAVTIEEHGLRWQTLIVRRDLLDLAEGFVPREAVLDADDRRIVITAPPVGGAVPSSRTISDRSEVFGVGDAICGRAVALLADEHGRLQHIVIQRRPFGERRSAPVESVVAIGPAAVVIDLTPEAVDDLPVYQDDDNLVDHAQEAVEGAAPLAEEDLHFLRVDVTDGVAVLTGHIRFRSWADRVHDAVAAIPGVMSLENQLVCDDELDQDVARVLASLPRTRTDEFSAQVHHGVVRLRGHAEDAARAEAACEMVANIPTVRGVVGCIDAPGFVKDEGWMDPPAIAEPVYADSGLVGSVERVVIDPRRRAFVGLVVHLRMPVDESPYSKSVERTSLIPRMETKSITEAAVYLQQGVPMTSEERPVRDLAVPAPPDWQPPFPYEARDVAWPATIAQPSRPS